MNWIVPAHIERVIDGDTVIVRASILPGRELTGEHIRVAGINAPELSTPEGITAKHYAQGLLPVGARIQLMMKGQDRYGRTVASVIMQDDRNFGDVMVSTKHAVVYMATYADYS